MIKASSRSEWRAWLVDNHATKNDVWLVYYKKHTGKTSVTYMESVKEALCFGWIDGIKKSIDDETYMHRFTPRKPGSKWSPLLKSSWTGIIPAPIRHLRVSRHSSYKRMRQPLIINDS